MRIHSVAALALGAMGLTSFSVWNLTPLAAEAAADPPDFATVAAADATEELPDRSHFVAGATLLLEGRLGHAQVPAQQGQSSYVFATINGAEGLVAPPSALDLAIVVDTSGSMRGERMTNALEAARGMVRRLRDQDRVTVITYSTRANVLVPTTVINGLSRGRVIQQLSGMRAQGATCISCGLELALARVRGRSDRVSRILLLSDGEATTGVRSDAGFQAIARRSRSIGTTMSTVGVDIEYNARIMGALAQHSNGHHYFVEHAHELRPVFDQEFDSLARTVATDVELLVDLAPGVEVERVFDREVRRLGNQLVVPVGTVSPGEEKTFLVQVRVPAGEVGERPVANLRLRYQDLVQRRPGECEGTLAARGTDDLNAVSALDPFVAARVSRSVTLNGIREANEFSAHGDFAAARRRLSESTAQVGVLRSRAMAAAEPASEEAVAQQFGVQDQALRGAGGGFSGAGLAAPAASPRGREARRRARSQERLNADLANPFAD